MQILSNMTRLFLVVLIAMALAGQAIAHSALDHSEPKDGAKLKQAPNEVRLWFTAPIKVALSSIEVRDSTGRQIDRRDLHADEAAPALIRLSLPALGPGAYKVIWSVVARDLHVTKGSFSFQVAP